MLWNGQRQHPKDQTTDQSTDQWWTWGSLRTPTLTTDFCGILIKSSTYCSKRMTIRLRSLLPPQRPQCLGYDITPSRKTFQKHSVVKSRSHRPQNCMEAIVFVTGCLHILQWLTKVSTGWQTDGTQTDKDNHDWFAILPKTCYQTHVRLPKNANHFHKRTNQ